MIGGTVSSHEGHSFGGMLITHEVHSDNTMTDLAEFLRFYHVYVYGKLVARQMPSCYSTLPVDALKFALFPAVAKTMQTYLHSAIALNQHSRPPVPIRRESVKRAIENGVDVLETSDNEEFRTSNLIAGLMQRHTARPDYCTMEILSLSLSNATLYVNSKFKNKLWSMFWRAGFALCYSIQRYFMVVLVKFS